MGFAATALPRDNFKFKFYPARRQHKRSLLTIIELLLGLLSSSLGHGVCCYCLATSLGNLGSLSTDILGSGQLSILLLYSRVRVKLQHGADVLQRVGLHNGELDFPVWCPQHLPDGFALEQGREISVGHLRLGKFQPGLAELALRHVPYKPSSFLKTASVQMQNLPTWPPGASLSRFRLSTWMVSTPGIFLNALVSPWS